MSLLRWAVLIVYMYGSFCTMVEGKWGPWTDWSVCSKTCGHGVVHRQRVCHLINSESEVCEGIKKQYKPCIIKNCQNQSDGDAECRKLNSKIYGGKRFNWKAFRNPYKRCELSCKAEGHHYYRSLNTLLSDGIPCKLNNNSYCLTGLCLSLISIANTFTPSPCTCMYASTTVGSIPRCR